MGETRWTPGPWEWEWAVTGLGSSDGRVLTKERHFALGFPTCIAVSPRMVTKEQWEANASLLAAAPDLYEALVGVIAVADRATVEFDRARAALALARGERP